VNCEDCKKTEATKRVHVNGGSSVVCDDCHAAIVRRIEHVANRFGRGSPNLQAITLMAIENITVEDLETAHGSVRDER
jgi:hypothetical protein